MKDPTHDSWRRFACAYLVRALRDARDPQCPDLAQEVLLAREARAWLTSDEARGLLLLLGYDPSRIEQLLGELGDLPDPPRPTVEPLTLEGFLHD